MKKTQIEKNSHEKCHKTTIHSKNSGIVVSWCDKALWSEFDRIHDNKHFSKYFLHKYSNFDKLIRIIYVVIKFISLLLSKVKTTSYDINMVMKTNPYNTVCRQSCYLSYVTMREMFAQQSHAFDAHSLDGESDIVKERTQKDWTKKGEITKDWTKKGEFAVRKEIITKSNYDLAFYAFVREAQLHALLDLFLELKSKYFSTQLPYYKGLVVFVDKFGLLRLLSLFNERCQIIDWSYVVKNLHRSKIIIPCTKAIIFSQ